MASTERGTAYIISWIAPFVFLIWEFVNHVLTGRFVAREAGLAAIGAVGLAAVLSFVARRVSRWEAEPADSRTGEGG